MTSYDEKEANKSMNARKTTDARKTIEKNSRKQLNQEQKKLLVTCFGYFL